MDFYKAYDLDDRWAIAFTRDFDRAEPVVYFLDKKYKHTNVCGIECQITCGAYYVSTILGHEDGYDLCLDGGIPEWTVPAETVTLAKKYCQEELHGGEGINNSRKAIKSSREESLALAFDRAEYCCKAIFGSEEGGRYQKWYCYGVSYGQDYAFFKVEHTDYSVRLSFEFMDTGFVYVDAYFTNGSSYDSKTIKNWNFEREVEDETAAGIKEVLDSFFDEGINILRGEEY